MLRVIYTSDTQNMSKKDLKDFKKYFHFITNFKNIYCTLQESIEFCDIKTLDKYGKSYLKYPKLTELHQKLFCSVPNNLHNSFNDVLVTLRCFMKLKFNTDVDDKCNMFKMIVNNLCVL